MACGDHRIEITGPNRKAPGSPRHRAGAARTLFLEWTTAGAARRREHPAMRLAAFPRASCPNHPGQLKPIGIRGRPLNNLGPNGAAAGWPLEQVDHLTGPTVFHAISR